MGFFAAVVIPCFVAGSFVQPRADLNDEEASKLGMKNEDDEVEKFVMANTQELGEASFSRYSNNINCIKEWSAATNFY